MKKGFTYLFLTVIVIASITINGNYVSAESISDIKDKINKLEKQQDKLKGEQGNLNSNKSKTEEKINKNKDKQYTVEQEINMINTKLAETQSVIDKKETEIVKTNNEMEALSDKIEKLKEDIVALQKRIEKRELLLKDRLRSIQKTGGKMGFIEVILGSNSFSDFISRSSAVTTIMDQDKMIMDAQTADKLSLEDKKTEVEDKKVEVENKKIALEEQRNELVSLKSQLDKQMKERESLMAQLQVEHEELQEYKVSLEEEQEILAAQASALKKAQQIAVKQKSNLEQLAREEAARKKANSANARPSIGSGNGMFSWPASGRVSSYYGMRKHPIFGVNRLHAGIDLAVPTGTTLRAAGSGVVSRASSMGGYGKAIMITHVINGTTYTTLYGHLSRISVSPGQVVNQGDVIGATGNTGDSTGPHLHFEVHVGGWNSSNSNSVNPLNYLK